MPVTASIIGNLGADPEVRTTSNGTKIVELRLASQDGKDKTSWWTAKFINSKAGEIAEKYAKKGSSVLISGLLEEETWEKDGQKKSKIVLNASTLNFLNSGKGGEKSSAPKADNKQNTPKQEEPSDDQDVPF
ncbi:MAG: Single-stranded DNA-binding protein [Ignavibacteriaceae bacterium]|nr:Single-stranded DNA-binding protein [Ignavibacteriaceae bacterium]